MIAALSLVVIVVVVLVLTAPGERFLRGFVQLLDEPKIERSAFSFFSGLSLARGKFRKRDAAIRLQTKRHRYEQGYLLVAFRTAVPGELNFAAIQGRLREEEARKALSLLVAHDLKLGVEGGWLKAQWKPQGFIIFPGPYAEATWRSVLEAMTKVAACLEAA